MSGSLAFRNGGEALRAFRAFIGTAMFVCGIEHFLHPTLLPGVPLVKQMPACGP